MLILVALFFRCRAESSTAIAPILTDSETLIRNSYHAEEARRKNEENVQNFEIIKNEDIEKSPGERIENEITESLNDENIQDHSEDDYQITDEAINYEFDEEKNEKPLIFNPCLLYTSPSPRDGLLSRMPSSA